MARVDLAIDQGATYEVVLRFLESSAPRVVRDLTGHTAAAQIRAAPGAPVILDLVSSGCILLDGAAGEIAITIPDEITAGLAPGRYRWDLLIETPAGSKYRQVDGKVTVSAAITL
jgi:hypothetical protein